MNKETFTVPAFEVTLERTDDPNYVRIEGVEFSIAGMRESVKQGTAGRRTSLFTAALAYLDTNKPDPKPGSTVRHEVDGEWKWTAIFKSIPTHYPYTLVHSDGTDKILTREEFAALCERDGVTL